MELKRVYHPETNEPFDVTASRAEALVLDKGWLQTPIDPKAVPAVTETVAPRGKKADEVAPAVDWRGPDEGDEAPVAAE